MAVKSFPWKKKYTMKGYVPNKPGIYRFYNNNGKMIYVGHAAKLRHRIQSYRQDDCFREHPTKKRLRSRIAAFKFEVMPKKKAQYVEKRIKNGSKFNFK